MITLANALRQQRLCPVCNMDQAAHLYTNTMSPIGGLDMSYQVSCCANCSFVFASELPAAEIYDAYYRGLSKYDVMASAVELSSADRVRIAATIRLCSPHIGKDALIADIGCGTGALLGAFKESGWSRLYGMDPAPGAPAKAASFFGLQNVKTGTLRQADILLPLDQASLVCLTGVLEHLPNLRGDMVALVERLNKSALILVEVPALERFIREPLEPYGEFSLEHIQYFSAQSLGRLMKELGYTYLAYELVSLPAGATDSLFGLFVRQDTQLVNIPCNPVDPRGYIDLSELAMQQVLERMVSSRAERLVLYGAGSHSVRLLPRLEAAGVAGRVIGVVDGNSNLVGQHIGCHEICLPDALVTWPDATIVVSSFNAQTAIVAFLAEHYPNIVLQLYS
jgi:hypothetical protein